jgi:hypothetical protein
MIRSSLFVPLGVAACLVACGGAGATSIGGGSSDSGAEGSSSGSSGTGGSGGSSSGSSSGGSGSSGSSGASGSSGSSGSSGASSSSGGATGDGATAFNVAGVAGLVLWLDAAKGITLSGSSVTAWADQSPSANNASEGRSALQPAIVSSAIHGLPAVSFGSSAGSDLILASSASLGWGTGDFLVEVVAEYNNVPQASTEQTNGYGELYTSIFGAPIDSATGVGLYANAPPIGGNAASTAFLGFAGGVAVPSAGTGYNDGAAHVFAMQRSGATFSVRLDGASVGSKAIGAGVDIGASAGAHLGGIENATVQELSGEIAEVIAVKGTIGAADLAGIEGYLVGKYALP